MDSQYSQYKSLIFSAALKVFPEAERLVEKVVDGMRRLYVEDCNRKVLAEVGSDGQFIIDQRRVA